MIPPETDSPIICWTFPDRNGAPDDAPAPNPLAFTISPPEPTESTRPWKPEASIPEAVVVTLPRITTSHAIPLAAPLMVTPIAGNRNPEALSARTMVEPSP